MKLLWAWKLSPDWDYNSSSVKFVIVMLSETNVRWIGDYMLYRIVQGPKSPGHKQVLCAQPVSLGKIK